MKCKVCSAETGSDRKQTCSDKCRKAASRKCDNVTVTSVTDVTVPETVTEANIRKIGAIRATASLADYYAPKETP